MTTVRVWAALLLGVQAAVVVAQQAPPAAPAAAAASVEVRPIEAPATPLPPEAASANITRFSFIAYGDPRNRDDPGVAGDGEIPNPEHARLVDGMLLSVMERASTTSPIRFVLQSGDSVFRGEDGAMWNISFSPIAERLTRGANLPYFLSVGNHDVTVKPTGDPVRALAVRNTLLAMSNLIPPEGSARRLSGYPTYAFGYGNTFFIAIDSNVASDPVQLAWVRDQLEGLDRTRYRHVIAFFHHPVYSSGPHNGVLPPASGTGQRPPDRVEPQTLALRALYMPLFRAHHVRMMIAGHDHLFDHWVERYVDNGVPYRIDELITGGGGAPIYTYAGEPDLRAYLAEGAPARVTVEHLMKPGATAAQNPHHFIVVQVDGDDLSIEVVGSGPAPFTPYNGRSTMTLGERR